MMSKKIVVSITLVMSVVILSFTLYVNATAPNLAMPDLSGHCLNRAVSFTTALTASSLTNIQSWQVNVTFDPGTIATMSYALGNPFTGQNTFTAARNSTAAGYFMLGMTFYNGAGPYTTASQVTLVTFTWKTLVYHPTVFFHIVLSSEQPQTGTLLLDPNQNQQQYTSTDGFLGCQLRPSH